eukprot:gnl/MRDRNA2_/MRDRNA2_81731_c0_seq1.p1 gnl/MRDRNA2_/MRDRNA2_81731_c0~~gnl/MRDRNA2_/MRDRNA2_81731_c0_seq1.p1  ORF type:complete len:123 (-),score=0.06 gnl/MRDRNA2_/MRDRNA2_81731_c0_seq1:53-421(-)
MIRNTINSHVFTINHACGPSKLFLHRGSREPPWIGHQFPMNNTSERHCYNLCGDQRRRVIGNNASSTRPHRGRQRYCTELRAPSHEPKKNGIRHLHVIPARINESKGCVCHFMQVPSLLASK